MRRFSLFTEQAAVTVRLSFRVHREYVYVCLYAVTMCPVMSELSMALEGQYNLKECIVSSCISLPENTKHQARSPVHPREQSIQTTASASTDAEMILKSRPYLAT